MLSRWVEETFSPFNLEEIKRSLEALLKIVGQAGEAEHRACRKEI